MPHSFVLIIPASHTKNPTNMNTKHLIFVTAILLLPSVVKAQTSVEKLTNRYNVLFIAVDDMNDWVGCFGGNSQAITLELPTKG